MNFRSCIAFLLFCFILSVSVTGISKAQADSLPPVLHSVSVDRTNLRPGDTLRFRFSASDQTGIDSVGVSFLGANGDFLRLLSYEPDSRLIEFNIPETALYGNYTLWQVALFDTAEDPNFAFYYHNGIVTSTSPRAPRTHSIDFSVADFSVNGTITTMTGPSASVYGHDVDFDVSVALRSGTTTGTPTGTVTLWLEDPDDFENTALGTATLSEGSARVTTGSLVAGNHRVFAVYNGSARHGPSPSSPLSHTVSQAPVDVELSVPSGYVRPGNPARLAATVISRAPGGSAPEGQILFNINGVLWEVGDLVGGRTSVNTLLPMGEYTVEAEYSAGYNHRAGTSVERALVISAAMGGEVTVNQRTRHNQQRPAIASLGRAAVVVYEDQLVEGGPFGITAQRVNWSGAPNNTAIEVAPPAEGTGFPHVAQMTGGSFVVVWEAAGQGGRQDIFMRRFRANGRAMDRAPRLVNDARQGNQTAPRVAALEDGGYAVVWESDSVGDEGDGIALRLFEPTGTPRGEELYGADGPRGPDVAVQQGGDIVVAWGEEMGAGNFAALARRISPQGTPLGEEIVVGHAGSSLLPHVRVAALDNGNFAVAFEASDHPQMSGPYRAIVQRLRQRGPHWGGFLPMERIMEGDQRTPALTGLRRMGLAMAWRAPDGRLNGVWVQPVDRNGNPIGRPERANTTIPGNQFDPAVARVGTTRNYFVVWTASGVAPGDGTNIIIRRFMGP